VLTVFVPTNTALLSAQLARYGDMCRCDDLIGFIFHQKQTMIFLLTNTYSLHSKIQYVSERREYVLALSRLLATWEEIRGITISSEIEDEWFWLWDPKGRYSAKCVYRAHFAAAITCDMATAIWSSGKSMDCRSFEKKRPPAQQLLCILQLFFSKKGALLLISNYTQPLHN
jgi:hypothetical protein